MGDNSHYIPVESTRFWGLYVSLQWRADVDTLPPNSCHCCADVALYSAFQMKNSGRCCHHLRVHYRMCLLRLRCRSSTGGAIVLFSSSDLWNLQQQRYLNHHARAGVEVSAYCLLWGASKLKQSFRYSGGRCLFSSYCRCYGRLVGSRKRHLLKSFFVVAD